MHLSHPSYLSVYLLRLGQNLNFDIWMNDINENHLMPLKENKKENGNDSNLLFS